VKVPNIHIVWIAALLIVSLGSWNCSEGLKNSGELPTVLESSAELRVQAVPVRLDDWNDTVPISGNLQTLSSVDVKAEIGGRLVAVHVREGAFVRKGELLAEIDDTNYQLVYRQSSAALRVAQAGLERSRISAEFAMTEKKRSDNLLQTGGITEKDHQAAITGLKEADAQVGLAEAHCLQAEAVLAIAEKALKDCLIHAPAGGQVQKRWMDEGTLLNPSSAIFTLVDNRRLELECVVPSYYLSSLNIGQEAEFTTPSWGGNVFKGLLSSINPAILQENRSVRINLKVDNTEMKLRSGMYARGFIDVDTKENVPVIPRDTLIPEENASDYASVYVVEEGVARRRRVLLGGTRQNLVWIQEGLKAGELLIVDRGPALRDGVKVHIGSDSAEDVR